MLVNAHNDKTSGKHKTQVFVQDVSQLLRSDLEPKDLLIATSNALSAAQSKKRQAKEHYSWIKELEEQGRFEESYRLQAQYIIYGIADEITASEQFPQSQEPNAGCIKIMKLTPGRDYDPSDVRQGEDLAPDDLKNVGQAVYEFCRQAYEGSKFKVDIHSGSGRSALFVTWENPS